MTKMAEKILKAKTEVRGFHRLERYVIINTPIIKDQIEEDKRRAIKRIMAIVDTQGIPTEIHQHIRKAVLDAINDLTRSYCETLDRVVTTIEPALDGNTSCLEEECEKDAVVGSNYCEKHRLEIRSR